MGNRCHAHRSPGVTGVCLEGGIDLYEEKIVSFGIINRSMAVRRMDKARGKSSIMELSEILVGHKLTANKRIVLMASWSSSV